jgi:Tfp pilus assembly protein PilN
MSVLTDSTPESGAPAGDLDLLAPVEYVAPRANLLPPEIAERAALRRLQALLVAAVIASGGIVGAFYVTTASHRGPAKAALAQALSEQRTLAAQKAVLAPAQVAHQQLLAAKQSLVAAMGSEVLWSDQLDTLRRQLPAGVRLSTLTVTGIDPTTGGTSSSTLVTPPASSASSGTAASSTAASGTGAANSNYIATVAMAGVALDNNAVANWLDTLAGMPGWGNVYLTSTLAGGGTGTPTVTYAITANITPAALSHRYTNGS